MALPKISAYAMPEASELPSNRASWPLSAGRAALLVHDMQGYFVKAFPPDESPVRELIANVRLLCDAARALGMPIYYSAQPGDQDQESRGLLADFWGPGLSRAPADQSIIAELGPHEGPNEIQLTKHRYSAFQKTELLASLRERGKDQLVICGVYAHLGCLLTAGEAFMNDIAPFFVADAVADFTAELHQMSLRYAAGRCAVTLSTEQALASLAPVPLRDGGAIIEQLRSELAELLDEGDAASISSQESLFDRGLDSIRLMMLVERFQQRGAPVTFGDLAEQPTLLAWATLIDSHSRVG
jgi:bifunctional isochorismate lyase / aryl carrier protein